MNWLYSCKRLAELTSQRLDGRLGPIDAMRLRLHLSRCANCSNVEKQLAGVNAAASDLFAGGVASEGEHQPLLRSGSLRGRAHHDD